MCVNLSVCLHAYVPPVKTHLSPSAHLRPGSKFEYQNVHTAVLFATYYFCYIKMIQHEVLFPNWLNLTMLISPINGDDDMSLLVRKLC